MIYTIKKNMLIKNWEVNKEEHPIGKYRYAIEFMNGSYVRSGYIYKNLSSALVAMYKSIKSGKIRIK